MAVWHYAQPMPSARSMSCLPGLGASPPTSPKRALGMRATHHLWALVCMAPGAGRRARGRCARSGAPCLLRAGETSRLPHLGAPYSNPFVPSSFLHFSLQQDTFESKSDTGIKLGVYGLLARVRAYCASNGISKTETSKLRQTADSYRAAFDSVKAPLAAAPPPPPPPPPPPMPPVAAPRLRFAPASRKGKVQFRTPLKPMNNDIMSAISGANRGMLKQTPFKLSPGGTPAKGTKFASDDPADAITKALRSKFKNVNMASPLAGSPSVFSPAPIESSGSTPYAEPVFFIDHQAPRPKLNMAM